MSSSHHLRYLGIACLALLLAFGLRIYLFAELGTQADEGSYAAAASRLLAGDLLYKDLYWNHTPGAILLTAATFKLAGSSLLLSRLLSVGAAMLTVAALILASRKVDLGHPARVDTPGASPWSHFIAGLLFAFAPLPIFWSHFNMLEGYETAFATLSIAFALLGLRKRAAIWWLLAGMLAGIALLFKISALTLIGSIGLFLALHWLVKRRAAPIRYGLLFAAGLALALLPVGLVLLAQGTLADFARFLSGVDRLDPLMGWQDKLLAFWNWSVRGPLIPLALLGGFFSLLTRRIAYLLPVIWVVAEIITLFLPPPFAFGWRGFSHYVLPAVAASSLVAGIGMGWAWRATAGKPGRRIALSGAALLLIIGTSPAFVRDLEHAAWDTTYPMPGFVAEKAIGRALALVTDEGQPVMGLANSIFYIWSGRPPASRYYFYPQFLSTSAFAGEAEQELLAALGRPDTGAVLLSGLYTTRLPQPVLNALSAEWDPVAVFPYGYQHDVTLYLPKRASRAPAAEPVPFENNIALQDFQVDVLAPDTVLVRLTWSAGSTPDENLSVFAHLLGPDGSPVTQHDSWPCLGSRPTVTWWPGEPILDYHWLQLPQDAPTGIYEVRVGLYQAETLQRLRTQTADGTGADSVTSKIWIQPH